VLCYNINGLSSRKRRLHDTDAYLQQHDIVLLTETRTQSDCQDLLPQHHLYTIPAASTGSGSRAGEGLLIGVRHSLDFKPSLWLADPQHDALWVKLTLPQTNALPLIIGLCYIPPQNSLKLDQTPLADRMLSLVQAATAAVTQAHVVLAGDFNARIGSLDDSWVADYDPNIPAVRHVTDQDIQGHGRQLVNLSKDAGLIICTGRVAGDTPAEHSYHRHEAQVTRRSRLDHFLVSPSTWGLITSCAVDRGRHDSDHAPIVMNLNIQAAAPAAPAAVGVPFSIHRWDATQQQQYAALLSADTCQQQLTHCAAAAAAQDVQAAAAALHSAITSAAAGSMRRSRPSLRPGMPSRPVWFDAECHRQKRLTRRAIAVAPAQQRILQQRFHSFTRAKRRAFAKQRLLRLTHDAQHNLHGLFAAARAPATTLPPSLQTPAAWDPLLQQLTQIPPAANLWMPRSPFVMPPATAAAAPLDDPIIETEVSAALQRLHNGRSGALLGYSSEFLRYAVQSPDPADKESTPTHVLQTHVTAVLNTAFSTGKIPDTWQTSLITPIFKRGNRADPTAYRPIAVGEPLVRLYAGILNKRLLDYTESCQLRSHTQAGFRPKLSTVHQLFTLQHLIDKQKHRKQQLYCCFVDLKSAYDKVQHRLLWQTLRSLGVLGKMLAAVQSLYANSQVAVKIQGCVGTSIHTRTGLRQGCPLSPTLFGLFTDGLHHYLQQRVPGAGVEVLQTITSDMEYADDVILTALSADQLQLLMDAMHSYCDDIGMTISAEKTKVVVFNPLRSANTPIHVWKCNGQRVQQADSFKYLGVHFHASGAIKHMVEHMRPRGVAAWAVVQQMNKQLQCPDNVNLKMKLYTNIVEPTLCYACEVWGVHTRTADAQRLKLEQTYEKQLRQICGIKQSVSASIVLWELGLPPLHVLWWQRTIRFWNKLASATDSPFHSQVLQDNLRDAIQHKAKNFSMSVIGALQQLGVPAPDRFDILPKLDEAAILTALTARRQAFWADIPQCPRACESAGVKRCTYACWFKRPSNFRFQQSYLALPMSGKDMRQLIRFRCGGHRLPVEQGRMHGIPRAHRVCALCTARTVCDEAHVVFECTAVAQLRLQFASLFTHHTQTMCSFVWQPDQRGVSTFLIQALKLFDA
jgi:exonuclease III